MHTYAGRAFDSCMTLTFNLLTSRSMHAKCLPYTLYVPSLVLIARAVLLLECEHTDICTISYE